MSLKYEPPSEPLHISALGSHPDSEITGGCTTRQVMSLAPFGPLDSSNADHRRTLELVMQKNPACFRITFVLIPIPKSLLGVPRVARIRAVSVHAAHLKKRLMHLFFFFFITLKPRVE